ncbi:MAG: DUF86 domain-containing protein [Leptolyngbyaceae cyanobacterium HOT.MB2.61]|nr:DUF86 domain-containing protein [Leptolyngbyaceae cyanobacterium HOT.MB2.61]
MLAAIEEIREFIKDITFDEFQGDRKTVRAVLYNLAIIGEAVRGIPPELEASHPEIPWEAEVLKDRLSNGKKGTECSILSPVKQKMLSDDSLVSQACQIGLDAALSTRLPRVELTPIL